MITASVMKELRRSNQQIDKNDEIVFDKTKKTCSSVNFDGNRVIIDIPIKKLNTSNKNINRKQ